MTDHALLSYIRDWARIIYDATGDQTKVNRAIELADLNGLFDPAKFALTRPTPAERPVPQVREALEQIERESDPERPGAYISAGERLATIRRIVCALLSARPSDALTGADAWDNLVNKDDRTSPEEYPDMALITREELIGYIQRSGGERPSDAAVAKEEAAHLHTIDQRDEAEGCVRNVYFKIIGRSPEWSNNFGYAEALEEIEEAVFLLKAAAKPLALPPDEPTPALPDGAVAWRVRVPGGFVGEIFDNEDEANEEVVRWWRGEIAPLYTQAADEIERLTNQLVKARALLEPFGHFARIRGGTDHAKDLKAVVVKIMENAPYPDDLKAIEQFCTAVLAARDFLSLSDD